MRYVWCVCDGGCVCVKVINRRRRAFLMSPPPLSPPSGRAEVCTRRRDDTVLSALVRLFAVRAENALVPWKMLKSMEIWCYIAPTIAKLLDWVEVRTANLASEVKKSHLSRLGLPLFLHKLNDTAAR